MDEYFGKISGGYNVDQLMEISRNPESFHIMKVEKPISSGNDNKIFKKLDEPLTKQR